MIIGRNAVYKPTSTGRPAMVAYAIDFGMTTAAAVNPAMTSGRNQSLRYEASHSGMPTYVRGSVPEMNFSMTSGRYVPNIGHPIGKNASWRGHVSASKRLRTEQ